MVNVRLIIEYQGSRYRGWQRQENAPSIQQCIEEAIAQISQRQVRLTVAGRTDAGVHAVGQVANFRSDHPMPACKYAPGINHHLPDDIRIHRSDEMPDSFSARADSIHKRYRYRLYLARNPAAMEDQAWHIKPGVSTTVDLQHQGRLSTIAAEMVERMRQAAPHFLGEQDFESFRSVHCDASHARRNIFAIDIHTSPRPPCGQAIEIHFFGNAFCRHMCRILAGTLVEVGQGKRVADTIPAAIAACDRRQAGITAPSRGLTLMEVGFAE